MSTGAPAGGKPRCTIIIPARDAAETIAETMASVRAQTVGVWQAIVVDDGSSDATLAMVRGMAIEEPRIQVASGPGRGVGAARNTGIVGAVTPFVSFLDADDLLAPEFLERMIPPLEADPDADATYTGWLRLAPDGTTEEGPCPVVDGDLFERFAAACVFPPHACVIRRSLLDEVGGFDEAPTTTEDWDLWQRVARTGARFVRVLGSLVTYRMRVGSRSRDSSRVLDDGLAVIARGHGPDPRVRRPHLSHETGARADRLARCSYNHLSWAIGSAIAFREDPSALLKRVAGVTAPDLEPSEIGGTLLESMRVTLCVPPSAAVQLIANNAGQLRVWLAALESASGTPDLALRTAGAIERLASWRSVVHPPSTLLRSHHVSIDLADPLADITELPGRVDRLRANLAYDGKVLGEIELPVCDGRVGSQFLADAAADALAWQLLRRFLGSTVLSTLDVNHASDRLVVRRNGFVLSEVVATELPEGFDLFDVVGWTVLLQELFGIVDRTMPAIFHSTTAEAEAPLVLDEPWLEADVCEPLRDARTDALSVLMRCTIGGAWLGDIDVSAAGGVVAAGVIRAAVADSPPDELVRVIAREGVIGWPLRDGVPLRSRLAIRHRLSTSREHRALPGGGVAMLRHAEAPIDGPSSRLTSLPIAARASIERLAMTTGRPVQWVPPLGPAEERSPSAAYLPDVSHGRRSRTIVRAAPASTPGNPDEERAALTGEHGVLVLACDRVTAEQSPAVARRSIHPSDFAEQLGWLRDAGYQSLRQDQWRAMARSKAPVRDRRVLLTFDGGYAEFAEHAWPALVHHGFTAIVFLVTGAIGGRSTCDAQFSEPSPTLDLATIRALHTQGVVFGSNTVSHPWLTGRPIESVVAELFDSRCVLEDTLGSSIEWLAYPFGAEDAAVRKIAAAAGYRFAVTRRPALWTHEMDRLIVPRRVVTGGMSLAEFAAACTAP